MACTHIAHDCIVGNNVIMANIATLGGHVEIGDWCNIGGGAMIHQFVKIGRQSLIGGGFSAKQDVPPFIIGAGIPLRFVGINKIGLERRKFSEDVRALIKKTYRTYFKSKLNRGDALKKIKNEISQIDEVKEIVNDFLEMIKEKETLNTKLLSEDEKTKLMCLSGVKQYPMRVKCATLSWHTLTSAIDKSQNEINMESTEI